MVIFSSSLNKAFCSDNLIRYFAYPLAIECLNVFRQPDFCRNPVMRMRLLIALSSSNVMFEKCNGSAFDQIQVF